MIGVEVELTSANFDAETASGTVLIDLWAPWCSPCAAIGSVISEIAREREGAIKVCRVNIDEDPALAARLRVMSIPTISIMRDGEEVDRLVGVVPKEEIDAIIDRALCSSR